MAVQRQQNWLGQARIDVPHLRALESGVVHDFDTLAGIIMAGKLPTVVNGFSLVETGAVGADAETLVMQVAGSALIHFEAAENGSVFRVPEDREDEVLGPTNAKVVGSFTPNSTNFVGIDLRREADDTTADTVQFLNDDTNLETARIVPLGRTLDYRIVISTVEISSTSGICPVAKVATNASNQVTSLTDARWLMFRLGSGGSNPQSVNPYGWPGGRNEANAALASVAGDRSITDLKTWMNATMSRIWEVGGGEYWYSATADRNVRMCSNDIIVATGTCFEWTGTDLHWVGLQFIFDNSTGHINEVDDQTTDSLGLTDLDDGECLYVDLDRTQNRTVAGVNPVVAQKGVLATLGMSATPGQRFVIAWRSGSEVFVRDQPFAVGSSFQVATTAANGMVTLSATPFTPLQPVVATDTTGDFYMGMSGFSRSGTGTVGDLTIGLGEAAGDGNILLYTNTGGFGVQVLGFQNYSFGNVPALRVRQFGDLPNYFDARTLELTSTLTGSSLDELTKHFWESDGAFGVASVTTVPELPPASGSDAARVKFFVKPSRFWKEDVRVATDVALPAYTAAGTGVGKTLTANANGALTIDGVAVSNGNRVLLSNGASAIDNGIYEVTDAGSGGTPFILTRSTDADTERELFTDVCVEVTDGTVGAGLFYRCITIPTSGYTLDTDPMVWLPIANDDTTDQYCAMWFDGSITVISQSPVYAGSP